MSSPLLETRPSTRLESLLIAAAGALGFLVAFAAYFYDR
jgi:hypothetical protein